MQNPPKHNSHWTDEAYRPIFSFTADEILAGKDRDDVKEQIVSRVSKYDADSISKVYEKVRLMTQVADAITEEQTKANAGVAEEKISTEKAPTLNMSDSCIWDSNEISVLRQVFREVKDENIRMKVKCRELEKRNKQLEATVSKQNKTLDEKTKKMLDAQKANSRLKINCNSLQSEIDLLSAKLNALSDLAKELSDEKHTVLQKDQELRAEYDKERLLRERLEMKLKNCNQEALLEKQAAEEVVRVKFEREVFDLKERLKDLNLELGKEKQVHAITRKGLDQLRQHYACIPLDSIISPNVVSEDQISKISY